MPLAIAKKFISLLFLCLKLNKWALFPFNSVSKQVFINNINKNTGEY